MIRSIMWEAKAVQRNGRCVGYRVARIAHALHVLRNGSNSFARSAPLRGEVPQDVERSEIRLGRTGEG
jgi:hypothetical protein